MQEGLLITGARALRHPHHDLADMIAAFHQPVRFHNLVQREDPVDNRRDLTTFDERPDLTDEVVADGAFFVRRAGTHGGASDGEAFDHDGGEIDLIGRRTTQKGDDRQAAILGECRKVLSK